MESILRNEKYKGSALLQKKFTVDFLQKKMKVNEGEVPQYYVEHSHPAIIHPEEWEKVQLELARRKNSTRRTNSRSPFSGKIVCGDCGEIFGAKVWHSTDKYRRTIWQCNGKFQGDHKCQTPHLYEDDLKQAFIVALSELLADRESLLEDGSVILHEMTDCTAIDAQIDSILQRLEELSAQLRQCVAENASQIVDQTAYLTRYSALATEYESLQSQYEKLQAQKEKRQIQAEVLNSFLSEISKSELLPLSFNDALWHATVDHVTVHADGRLVFHFKNGSNTSLHQ